MSRMTRKCPSFSNVQAGSTATLQLPLGLTYHMLYLNFSGITLAQMKNIRIEVDGKPIKKWADGTRLDMENQHYGRGTATADILPIFFVRPELQEINQRRIFALGTSDVQTMSLLIDIDAAAAAPVLEATSVRSAAAKMGYITRIMEFKHASAVAGEIEIDNIPLRQNAAISAIHIYSADVTKASLQIDDGIVWEMTNDQAAKIQADHGRTPQEASKMTLDFLLEGDFVQAIALQGVQDFRIKPTLSAAGSMDIVVEYLEEYNANA